MCGENSLRPREKFLRVGSPPRVRGKRGEDEQRGCLYGITPACAGKTTPGNLSAPCAGDHPRVCGENAISRLRALAGSGSPPRVRGKHGGCVKMDDLRGITPACAGKTIPVPLISRRAQDHPRVCGENSFRRRRDLSAGGSPPRVRGKPGIDLFGVEDFGITPACAGKTFPESTSPTESRDHPRVCGENWAKRRISTKIQGSPPRVRGKQAITIPVHHAPGITPACAGKTLPSD